MPNGDQNGDHLKLSQKTIQSLREPGVYGDDVIRGLAVRISKSGKRDYIYRDRRKGSDRIHNLGRVESMTLVEARLKVDQIQQKTHFLIKFEDFQKRYHQEHVEVFDSKRTQYDKSHYFSAVLPFFKGMDLSEIKKQDVIHMHQFMRKERGPVTANRHKSYLSAMLNVAIQWGVLKENPAAGIRKFPEKERERFLGEDELGQWTKAVDQEPEPYRTFYFTALYTGARRSEILRMEWGHLNKGTWTIFDTKNGETHTVPLHNEILKEIENLPQKTKFVFAGKKGTPINGFSKSWARIKNRSGLNDLKIHDIRRTFGSTLANAGLSIQQIMKAMNHKTTKSALIYQRIDERAKSQAINIMADKINTHK